MIAGAAAAIVRCNALGIPVVVVTNQAGIGRGYYGWDDFHAVQGALMAELAAAGAHLDGVVACAYHGDGRETLRVADHPWRKPNPGMIVEAASRMQLDLPARGSSATGPMILPQARLRGSPAALCWRPTRRSGKRHASLAAARFMVETASDLAGAVAALIDRRQFEDRGRLICVE